MRMVTQQSALILSHVEPRKGLAWLYGGEYSNTKALVLVYIRL